MSINLDLNAKKIRLIMPKRAINLRKNLSLISCGCHLKFAAKLRLNPLKKKRLSIPGTASQFFGPAYTQ
nr:hypothetical protein [Chitinophaga sp. sic0106]